MPLALHPAEVGIHSKFWRWKAVGVLPTVSSGFTDALKSPTLELGGSLQYTPRMAESTHRGVCTFFYEKEARNVSRGVILPHDLLCAALWLLLPTVI